MIKYPVTLLLISQERDLLDNVSPHPLAGQGGGEKLYVGDYTAFERQRAEQLRQQQIAHDKEQVERAHLQSLIDRFKAKASKAKQAQSRMKRLAKLAGTEAVRAEREMRIEFPAPTRLPHALLRLNHADCGYAAVEPSPSRGGQGGDGVPRGEEHHVQPGETHPLPSPPLEGEGAKKKEGVTLLRDVGFGLEAGDCIGLPGANGPGKSTLVKTLVGELEPLAGERYAHPDLRIGYFAQHTVEALRAGTSPVDHLRELSPDASTQAFRDFLGKWNFPGDPAFEKFGRTACRERLGPFD